MSTAKIRERLIAAAAAHELVGLALDGEGPSTFGRVLGVDDRDRDPFDPDGEERPPAVRLLVHGGIVEHVDLRRVVRVRRVERS